ncbi:MULTISPECIES: PilZ domain-containing protein [unclassified Anaerobiospirillum]|uniref:PilZ domain-containing protein n=1 Tax=unclassified Anaerobiospirillum TaxID=2647410 RepID=UPI001FF15D88|nr:MULTISPECIES: PilZ domain-containing protein [unclassified Anaerobiospirillum]MCK0527283.1 PilZ domain-containing protein [Anaerobiospirillum sp. NML120449]MCK0535436.1 PilZ domain-containing protein [Anaerobiospirillum sp. NML120511]MCK0540847.1 PilZ domain-containing protein [Anaerobiospirillum sp. NML02-A-032]
MERRKYSRVALDLEGILQSEVQKKNYMVLVHDVSLKGAFVELRNFEDDPHFFKGQKYRLVIELQATTKITMLMICRHVIGKKLGLECERIDSDSISNLRRLVEMNVGRSDILGRELNVLMHND